MAQITRSNPKAFEAIYLHLSQLAKVQGKVGWFESSKYEDGTPVAYVAAIQELGSGPIPPRPFMRTTAAKEKDKWSQTAAMAAKSVIKGDATAKQAMELITFQAEGDVSKTIASITSPALSPITIELRAMKARNPGLKITGATVGEAAAKVNSPGYQTPSVSTKPLVDTGHMIATLTHIVESA